MKYSIVISLFSMVWNWILFFLLLFLSSFFPSERAIILLLSSQAIRNLLTIMSSLSRISEFNRETPVLQEVCPEQNRRSVPVLLWLLSLDRRQFTFSNKGNRTQNTGEKLLSIEQHETQYSVDLVVLREMCVCVIGI